MASTHESETWRQDVGDGLGLHAPRDCASPQLAPSAPDSPCPSTRAPGHDVCVCACVWWCAE
eukprot:3347309-Rhodomonas_salina.1